MHTCVVIPHMYIKYTLHYRLTVSSHTCIQLHTMASSTSHQHISSWRPRCANARFIVRVGVDLTVHEALVKVGPFVQPLWPTGRLFSSSYANTPNLPTNIVSFRGFDSSIRLISRGGIPRPIGDFPESLTRAILVGVMLVGRLGVYQYT